MASSFNTVRLEKVSTHSSVRFVRFLASAISETLPPITLSFDPRDRQFTPAFGLGGLRISALRHVWSGVW